MQRRTILFHRQAIEGTKRRLAEAPGGFTASEAGTLLGISLKYGIPLLERLDALRITRWVGDRRFLIRGSTAGRATAILAR
ncbi:SelB C-terminal domain-containing protein [Belnapia sp. F-4-1]|uniref:SelB domain-containing protein n=1 Tax=Belnapia sp. F-4-1 TaxID=1545443 RepID=UPI00068ECE2A|nr:SelB C-terminal domain-containing protein [Belnapia sp. F-4-1]